jgi:outer membrane protein assembly factor BamB
MLCGLILASTSAVAWADNWPSWRGPDNNGICKEKKVPIEWSATKNMAWKLTLPGPGSSTPAIWGDRMFLTCVEKNDVLLMAIGTDGKEKWRSKLGVTGKLKINKAEANEASNSCSTDGKHLWAFDGTGIFACYDVDGKEIWRFDVVERYGKFSTNWGLHTTPLLDGDRLYLTLLHQFGHWLIAIDKATGNELWKSHRKTDAQRENKDAYTSPYIWRNDKETCIVIVGCDYVTGHSMKDGAEIWRLPANPKPTGADRIIPSPVAADDVLVACTGRTGGLMFAVKPGGQGTLAPNGPFVQWQKRGAPDVPSPLIHEGLVYLCSEDGRLTCTDLKSGTEYYSKISLHGGRYRASPVYADGNVYITARDEGYVTVVKTGPKFEKVADNHLDDIFTASPAISNGRLYLRGFKNLYAIETSAK